MLSDRERTIIIMNETGTREQVKSACSAAIDRKKTVFVSFQAFS